MKVNKCNPPFTGVNYMITFFMRNKKKKITAHHIVQKGVYIDCIELVFHTYILEVHILS